MLSKVLRLAIDATAAAALGGSISFALSSFMQLPWPVAVAGGALVFGPVFSSLVRLPDDVAAFTPFQVAPFVFDEEEDELLLDRPISREGAQVVRLFDPIPTPGELHQTIERHLRGSAQPGADATDELRDAIAQLRRAIG